MRISTVSERTDLSVDTLRYYERIGLIPPIDRSKNGVRDYTETDIKRIEFIKCLKKAGLSIKALTEYMELLQQGDGTMEARKEILVNQRKELASKLEEMQETLDFLDYKIGVYEDRLFKKIEKEIISAGD